MVCAMGIRPVHLFLLAVEFIDDEELPVFLPAEEGQGPVCREFSSWMSSTANARFDGLIILPRRPPKSPGPFFAKVITLQLWLVPFLSFVALFLIVWHASILP